MVNIIRDREDLTRGLYPGKGENPSTAQGGGKPKTDFYCAVAKEFFTGHDTYGAAYRADRDKVAATTGKKRKEAVKELKKWGLKVKNRLRECVH